MFQIHFLCWQTNRNPLMFHPPIITIKIFIVLEKHVKTRNHFWEKIRIIDSFCRNLLTFLGLMLIIILIVIILEFRKLSNITIENHFNTNKLETKFSKKFKEKVKIKEADKWIIQISFKRVKVNKDNPFIF